MKKNIRRIMAIVLTLAIVGASLLSALPVLFGGY